MNPTLRLDPLRLRRGVVLLAMLLGAAHGAVIPLLLGDLSPAVRAVVAFADLDAEQGIGTLVATVLLAACAGSAWLVGRLRPLPSRRSWSALAGLLLALAADEALSVHEGLDRLLDDRFPDSPLEFAWVVPYVAVAVVVAIAAVPFLRRLDRPVARGLVLGGATYVAGAAGIELLGGLAVAADGFDSVAFLVLAGLEEVVELIGTGMVLAATLGHAAGPDGHVEIELRSRT